MNKTAAVARGDMPADLVIKNARIANVVYLPFNVFIASPINRIAAVFNRDQFSIC